jgi:hypothetical protein
MYHGDGGSGGFKFLNYLPGRFCLVKPVDVDAYHDGVEED